LVVVADSSPLIYLAALSDFALLHELFDELLVPSAVWREVVDQGEGFRVQVAARDAAAAGWLRVAPLPSPAEPIRHGSHELHSGETEVIRLSQQLRADILLMDDRSAVVYARALGFRVIPTIAIYIEAKRKSLIGSVRDRVDALRAAGFHLTERDYGAALAAAGES
jgi:predicted nucleic acid-binding protein